MPNSFGDLHQLRRPGTASATGNSFDDLLWGPRMRRHRVPPWRENDGATVDTHRRQSLFSLKIVLSQFKPLILLGIFLGADLPYNAA